MTFLTKTEFRSGLQCVKKLWCDSHKTIEPTPPRVFDKLNFKRGREVESIARKEFDDCFLIEMINLNDAANKTQKAIRDGCRTLAEATFIHDNLAARIDVLQQTSKGAWNLIEIKMSGQVKKEHIQDVAFQKYVTELSGLKIDKCFVMHLNKQCMFPDLSNLFSLIDVTDSVLEISPEISSDVSNLLNVVRQTTAPEVRIGNHCKKPHGCHFQEHCWRDVPFHSIFTIPRIGAKKIEALLNKNILEVAKVPESFKLTDKQEQYVNLVKKGLPKIAQTKIVSFLDKLEYPLYFLDFEADRPPIPQFQGMNPFSLLPFQFSLHIMDAEGALEHHAFLHTENSDCREQISAALDKYIGATGSVVVYNKSFEKEVLESLASFANQYETKLLSIRDRLWDQYDIFKKSYMHPAFAGSNSLKVVLENLVPTLSYSDMNVSSGDVAIAFWVKMLTSEEQREKDELKSALEHYCHLDTLAMVEIHKHILELI